MNELFMGIDIGTSGVRAAMFDVEGRMASLYHNEYPMICSEKGMGELDPDVIFRSLIAVTKKCIEVSGAPRDSIKGIGLSTQMHSILALDENHECLTNVITWADTRAIGQAEYIRENFDCSSMYHNTGCRIQHPMYPLSKILWLKTCKPELFKKAKRFATIKEYVLYKLFGSFTIDIGDASSMGYFNIHKFGWDEGILEGVLGLTSEYFGEPVDCTYVLTGIRKQYADEMGIDRNIPVAIGSGDGMMANLGCGVFDNTAMSCTIGTSGAVRVSVDKPLLDTRQRTWCYCFSKDSWLAGGAINNGGVVLKWLRDEYRKQYELEAELEGVSSIYHLFDKYAEEIKPGSDGLIFLPLLTGERSPNWNANAKGTIHGIQLIHGRKHFIRAAMEGVMYRMFSVYEALSELNSNVQQIRANGGYINSDVWLQIQADIFDKEIAVAGVGEAAVFGAAYTAMVAEGAVKNLKTTLPVMKPSKIIKPSGNSKDVYREAYESFRELYAKIYS